MTETKKQEVTEDAEEVGTSLPVATGMTKEEQQRLFLSEMARFSSPKGKTPVPAEMTPAALGYDPGTTIPMWDGPYSAYYILRTSAENPDKLVWDIVFMPNTPGSILVKYPLEYPTKWGLHPSSGFEFSSVIKNRTTDHENARIAPVKILVSSDEMMRQCVSPPQVLADMSYEDILKGTRTIEKHDATILAHDLKNAESATATWQEVVRRGFGAHFKVAGELSAKGQRSDDRGTEATAKTFRDDKGILEQIKDNFLCIIILVAIFLFIALQNAGVIQV